MIDLTAKSESRSRTFKDVHVDSWAYEIRFLKDKQVIKGFSNNNFKPLTTLTCKDATIMIVRALKLMLITHLTTKSVDLKPSMGDYTEMIIAENKEMFTITNNSFPPTNRFLIKMPIDNLVIYFSNTTFKIKNSPSAK